jgi:predicted transcriptional regulator
MSNAEYLAKAAELRADQLYWEAVKRNAYAELQSLPPDPGMYTDNDQEQLRSQISNAAYRLDQIAQELNRIERLREVEALKEAASRSAIRNPVSESEAGEFFEEQKRTRRVDFFPKFSSGRGREQGSVACRKVQGTAAGGRRKIWHAE